MIDLLILLHRFLVSWFKSRARLEAENLMLWHRINILRRRTPKRLRLRNLDRLIIAAIYRLVPVAIEALATVKPAAVIRLRRLGFRALLALEITPQRRPLEGVSRDSSTHSTDELEESALGSS